jgi:hypothetical protein
LGASPPDGRRSDDVQNQRERAVMQRVLVLRVAAHEIGKDGNDASGATLAVDREHVLQVFQGRLELVAHTDPIAATGATRKRNRRAHTAE